MAFVIATLLTIAWGIFAFGAVYPWAMAVLAPACALLGIAGLLAGRRTFRDTRWIFVALATVAALGLLQQIPLSAALLSTLSEGTLQFLANHDLAYQFGLSGDPEARTLPAHAISLAPRATWVALALLGAFTLFLAGLIRNVSSVSAAWLARGIVALGAVLALIGIVQYTLLGDNAYLGMKIYGFWAPESLLTTPFGPFVNKNHFAGCVLMILPLALGLAMGEYERGSDSREAGLRGWLLWLSSPHGGRTLLMLWAASIMTMALLMTRLRSGLGGFAAIAIGASVVASRRSRSMATGVKLAAGFVLLIGAAALWAGQNTAMLEGRVQASPIAMRVEIWQIALSIFRDFPVFGAGLNTFGVATILYQPPGGGAHYFEAHNDYVQLLAEGGAALGLIVIAAVCILAFAIRRRFQDGRDQADTYWLRVGATLGLIAIALQSGLEFSLQMPGNAALFTVLMALALYSPLQSAHARPRSSRR